MEGAMTSVPARLLKKSNAYGYKPERATWGLGVSTLGWLFVLVLLPGWTIMVPSR
jgi:hypothetical protein